MEKWKEPVLLYPKFEPLQVCSRSDKKKEKRDRYRKRLRKVGLKRLKGISILEKKSVKKTIKLLVANSTPIVGLLSRLNSSFVNLERRLDYTQTVQ